MSGFSKVLSLLVLLGSTVPAYSEIKCSPVEEALKLFYGGIGCPNPNAVFRRRMGARSGGKMVEGEEGQSPLRVIEPRRDEDMRYLYSPHVLNPIQVDEPAGAFLITRKNGSSGLRMDLVSPTGDRFRDELIDIVDGILESVDIPLSIRMAPIDSDLKLEFRYAFADPAAGILTFLRALRRWARSASGEPISSGDLIKPHICGDQIGGS